LAVQKDDAMTATGCFCSLTILGVPVLMGSQNWNDHDRSDRYTAVDFAVII